MAAAAAEWSAARPCCGSRRVIASPPPGSGKDKLRCSGGPLHPKLASIFVDRRVLVSRWPAHSVGVVVRRRHRHRLLAATASSSAAASKGEPSKTVLVTGATGGVGQLLVASLFEKGVKVRALLRNAEKAKILFGDKLGEQLEFRIGDTRQRDKLEESLFEGVTHVINATGTTAFPSLRWRGENGPKNTDWIGVRNLVDAVPRTVQRMVLISSIGVTKTDELPWNILNLFGVLKYKKMGEDYLKSSGIPFTIIRAGQLIDGPYTAYDLPTLFKMTSGTRRSAIFGQGDKLVGRASRVIVAEACVQALDLEAAKGQTYEVISEEGEGPGRDAEKWASTFQAVNTGT